MKIERVVKTITLGKTVIVDDLEQSEGSEHGKNERTDSST